jgi:hypothetical protein
MVSSPSVNALVFQPIRVHADHERVQHSEFDRHRRHSRLAAALVVSAQNFTDPNVITTLLVGTILLLLLLMPTARQLGSRTQAPAPIAEPAAGS